MTGGGGAAHRSLCGEQIGPYRVTRELGRGGMGIVYEGVHERIGHRAAIKILPAELAGDPGQREYVGRLHDEARAVNIVQHPGLVKIFDQGERADGAVYLVMELLPPGGLAERLEQVLQSGQRFPVREALRLSRQIASAMAAAHDKGIVHRDLKPENVLLQRDPDMDGGERIKIVDFGIARFLETEERRTTAGAVLGTPIYMSPEQCQGGDASDKGDVYALGIMLYEMLAGAPPFQGHMAQVVMMHVMAEPRPLGEVAVGLPPAVYQLVGEMLAKGPKERPGMAQVCQRLGQIEEGLGSRGEVGPTQRVEPFVSVRAGSARLVAALCGGGVLGGLLVWGLLQIQHRAVVP